MSSLRIILTVLVLLGWTAAAGAQSCCMPAVGEDPQAARLVAGIQSATLLLLAVPPALVGAIALWFYRNR